MDLGLDVGTAGQNISLYETGQRVMKVDRLFQIADALNVTPTELCPKRFDQQEKPDPRLYQLGIQMKGLTPEMQEAVFRSMEAMIVAFQSVAK